MKMYITKKTSSAIKNSKPKTFEIGAVPPRHDRWGVCGQPGDHRAGCRQRYAGENSCQISAFGGLHVLPAAICR